MAQALLYADEHALAAYLGGAALVEPALARSPVEALDLIPREGDDASPSRAILFEDDDLALPIPPEDASGACLYPADYDRGAGVLTLRQGKGRIALRVRPAPRGAGPGQLVHVLRPISWVRAPDVDDVLYLCRTPEAFADLVREHLELGRDRLRYAVARSRALGEVFVLEVAPPAWFLLERWIPARRDRVQAYRRVRGPAGPRRVYVEWGWLHPLESWLGEPEQADALLLLEGSGAAHALPVEALRDVGEALDLRAGSDQAQPLAEGELRERVRIPLRLEGRVQPLDPELWLLPERERVRLEQLLTQTPEEELRNLLVACVERPGGERLFAVREVLSGRARPRLLPLGERAFAPQPGLPGLLLPCGATLAPPLGNDRYARAFELRPGVLTVVEAAGERGLALVTLEERAFRPIGTIVDFVVDAEAERLEQVLAQVPFDLGSFAEVDLVPAHAPRSAAPEAPAAEAPRSEPVTAKPRARRASAKEPAARSKQPAKESSRAAPAKAEPSRQAIARLEEQLALGEGGAAESWLLFLLLWEESQLDEALRAAEDALWVSPAEEQEQRLRELAERLGPAGGEVPQDSLGLYRRVLAYRRELAAQDGGGADAERYRSSTEAVYAALREHQARLRKKTRWLLWSLVLRETHDAIEEERQREDVLADLVLRGVEAREVPAFVRRVLIDHYGLRAATGTGAGHAVEFLVAARRFAERLGHAAFSAESLAHVAGAFAELGEVGRARELAELAERAAGDRRGAPAHVAYRARALARAGAVLERVGERARGAALLGESLEQIARQLGQTQPLSQEWADAHKAMVVWFAALADARGAQAERKGDALLERGLEALAERPLEKQVHVLSSGAAEALVRLGATEWVQRRTVSLLAQPAVQQALHNLEDLVYVLGVVSQGQPLSAADAARVWEAILGHASQMSEFTLEAMEAALRALPGPTWEAVERAATALTGRDQAYAARLVRLAGLRRLAEQRERQRGPDLLAEALEDAWRHQGSPVQAASPFAVGDSPAHQRMRLITRLAALVPAFGMRERGLALLTAIKERARGEAEVSMRNELLTSTALAASKLGDSRAAAALVEEVAGEALAGFQEARGRGAAASWLLFETLESCVAGMAELGDVKRGMALIERVAAAARDALREGGDSYDAGRFFYARALIGAGRAALSLGDVGQAQACFRDVFRRLGEFQGQDRIDLLQAAAATAGRLEGEQRYALATQVLEAARSPGEGGDSFERFAVELTQGIARDMVQGESAFAAALKRWKGREERTIRDRVVAERPAKGEST